MNTFLGESVVHKKYGTGTVISQCDNRLRIKFDNREMDVRYPDSFQSVMFFTNNNLQKEAKELFIAHQQEIARIVQQVVNIPISANTIQGGFHGNRGADCIIINMHVPNTEYASVPGNIPHDIINMSPADDGKYYIWLNAKGTIPKNRLNYRNTTVLMVEKCSPKLFKVIGKAEECQVCPGANPDDSANKGCVYRFNIQKALGITYQKKPIEDLFQNNTNNGVSDAENIMVSYSSDTVKEAIDNIFITNDIAKANNKTIFYFNFTTGTSLRYYIEQTNSTFVDRMIDMINNPSIWKTGCPGIQPHLADLIKHPNVITVGIEPFEHALKQINCNNEIVTNINHSPSRIVEYDNGISKGEQIPELVPFLKHEIDSVYYYLNSLIPDFARTIENLKVILSPLRKENISRRQATLSDVYGIIQKYELNNVHSTPNKELLALKKGITTHEAKLGEYTCENGYPIIYIFYRVLNTSGTFEYFAEARAVLAHEMLHAVHHAFTASLFYDDYAEAKFVKEALADFFGFLYSISPSTCVVVPSLYPYCKYWSDERHAAWLGRLPYKWPYAYASYFLPSDVYPYNDIDSVDSVSKHFIGKYREVFAISKKSMEHAYDYLINSEVENPPLNEISAN